MSLAINVMAVGDVQSTASKSMNSLWGCMPYSMKKTYVRLVKHTRIETQYIIKLTKINL